MVTRFDDTVKEGILELELTLTPEQEIPSSSILGKLNLDFEENKIPLFTSSVLCIESLEDQQIQFNNSAQRKLQIAFDSSGAPFNQYGIHELELKDMRPKTISIQHTNQVVPFDFYSGGNQVVLNLVGGGPGVCLLGTSEVKISFRAFYKVISI